MPGRGAAVQGPRVASMLVMSKEKQGANCGHSGVSQRAMGGSGCRKVTGLPVVSAAVGSSRDSAFTERKGKVLNEAET